MRLNPTKLIHRVELGRTLLRLGRKQEAYGQLTTSVALDIEDVNAKLQKEDADLLLEKLRKEFERSVQPLAFFGGAAAEGAGAAPGQQQQQQDGAVQGRQQQQSGQQQQQQGGQQEGQQPPGASSAA